MRTLIIAILFVPVVSLAQWTTWNSTNWVRSNTFYEVTEAVNERIDAHIGTDTPHWSPTNWRRRSWWVDLDGDLIKIHTNYVNTTLLTNGTLNDYFSDTNNQVVPTWTWSNLLVAAGLTNNYITNTPYFSNYYTNSSGVATMGWFGIDRLVDFQERRDVLNLMLVTQPSSLGFVAGERRQGTETSNTMANAKAGAQFNFAADTPTNAGANEAVFSNIRSNGVASLDARLTRDSFRASFNAANSTTNYNAKVYFYIKPEAPEDVGPAAPRQEFFDNQDYSFNEGQYTGYVSMVYTAGFPGAVITGGYVIADSTNELAYYTGSMGRGTNYVFGFEVFGLQRITMDFSVSNGFLYKP